MSRILLGWLLVWCSLILLASAADFGLQVTQGLFVASNGPGEHLPQSVALLFLAVFSHFMKQLGIIDRNGNLHLHRLALSDSLTHFTKDSTGKDSAMVYQGSESHSYIGRDLSNREGFRQKHAVGRDHDYKGRVLQSAAVDFKHTDLRQRSRHRIALSNSIVAHFTTSQLIRSLP